LCWARQGLTAIINDQLVSNVFSLACLASGMFMAMIGYFYGWSFGNGSDLNSVMIMLGFMVGWLMTGIVMNVVDSAVVTIFVLYAEAPEALQRVAPELFVELSDAWALMQQPPVVGRGPLSARAGAPMARL
jgi:hypothetical protein